MCLQVCVCSQKYVETTNIGAQSSYWQTSNCTRIRNNKRLLLLKPFGYKLWQFISLTVTVSGLEKTSGDNQTHLNITNTLSWLSLGKYCIKSNTIEHWLQAFLPWKLLFFTYFKSCAVHVVRASILLRWDPFFLFWDKVETKM